MIHQLNMYGKDKVQVAIERLQSFEPKEEGYALAFSGGKDSVVVKKLADDHWSSLGRKLEQTQQSGRGDDNDNAKKRARRAGGKWQF